MRRAGAELIYAGKRSKDHAMPQEEINELLVAKARTGKRVVRLKGGDPYVFGRGGEEAQALAAAKIPFEVVPGVSSVIAAPGYAGIPLTHREHCSSFTVFTGHEDPTKTGAGVDWAQAAKIPGTKVILMGVSAHRGRLRANLWRSGMPREYAGGDGALGNDRAAAIHRGHAGEYRGGGGAERVSRRRR